MIRKLSRAALFVAAATVVASGVGMSADEKKYTIEDIMKKGHGNKGLLKALGGEIKAGKWDAAKTDSALLKDFGEALGTLKPEKGTPESWKTLTDKYKEQTAAVADAVEKKDAKASADALAKVTDKKTCGACHSVHKP